MAKTDLEVNILHNMKKKFKKNRSINGTSIEKIEAGFIQLFHTWRIRTVTSECCLLTSAYGISQITTLRMKT